MKNDTYYRNFKKPQNEIFETLTCCFDDLLESYKPPKDLNIVKDYVSSLITKEKAEDAK